MEHIEIGENIEVVSQEEVLGKVINVYGDCDEPLFLAKDIAEILNRNRPADMVKPVSDTNKKKATILYEGKNREMWLVTKGGIEEILTNKRVPIAEHIQLVIREFIKGVKSGKAKQLKGSTLKIDTQSMFEEEGLAVTKYQQLAMQSKLENTKVRKAQILNKIARDYSGAYKQALQAYAVSELVGVSIIPIPEELKHLIDNLNDIDMNVMLDVGDVIDVPDSNVVLEDCAVLSDETLVDIPEGYMHVDA